MEGMPLKYIAMLIIAAIIVSAMVNITGMLTSTTIASIETANSTMTEILHRSLGDALKGIVTP